MSDQSLNKVYEPQQVEEKWTALWEKEGLFHASVMSDRPSFSMVIPPPNVTGSLHLGHALNNTLQDILARWKRMSGYNVLWLPGTDHAGIATQNVVERRLAASGEDRWDMGREAFIKKVWEWKADSGGTILNQLKRLGASCDWARERFTMDPGLSRAVEEVFVRLYNEGLIYRAQRLINLCPHCRTALSDIEVEHEEVEGVMYFIKYPLAEDPAQCLTVATTRPETMLADTAVAVHPGDSRYNRLIGKKIHLPLTRREIPVIADPILVDREFGTGAVKITPGHDFNDEKSGKRHNLETISLIDWSGEMNAGVLQEGAKVRPDLVKSLSFKSMSEARKIVVNALEAAELLRKSEPHTMALGKCYRCKSVVEPFYSPQWFVKVNAPGNSLAKPAVDAVRQKKIRLIPESWAPNYFGWMENIEDWCISRQIWWGHQIPVWYCRDCDPEVLISRVGVGTVGEGGNLPEPSDETVYIGIDARPVVGEMSCPECGGANLVQDPDVLDTWFSSALWPFSTLGWPPERQAGDEARAEAKALLERFYPTAALVSGFDILFFWVARMIMMGLHFMKDVPFREVYIHALVRDAEGQKMSKSKGNVIDPLDLMAKFGTDALRFTLASMASPGRDIKLSEARIQGYRNFCNKLWNAARFIQMNAPEDALQAPPPGRSENRSLASRWIVSRLQRTIEQVTQALNRDRFDEAAQALYQFTWHSFCDWYLELVKVDLQEEAHCEEASQTLHETFDAILRLLHPFMPFLTEELWQQLQGEQTTLSNTSFPKYDLAQVNSEAEAVVNGLIIETVLRVRNHRGEMNIPPSEKLPLFIKTPDKKTKTRFEAYLPYIKRLARLGEVRIGVNIVQPKMSTSAMVGASEIYIPLDEIRLRDEIARIEKRSIKTGKMLGALAAKLSNQKFTTKAPKAIVEKVLREQADLLDKKAKLSSDLQDLRNLLQDPPRPQ